MFTRIPFPFKRHSTIQTPSVSVHGFNLVLTKGARLYMGTIETGVIKLFFLKRRMHLHPRAKHQGSEI